MRNILIGCGVLMALGVLLLAVVIISAALSGNLNVVYIQGNDKTVSVGSSGTQEVTQASGDTTSP